MVIALGLSLCAPVLLADDATRAVQEELRKRHLFHGDIDGRQTPALISALREYQQRKGFAVTGVPDEDTLRSMGISARPPVEADLPEGPVLRSDRSGPGGGAQAVSHAPPPMRSAPVNAPPPTKEEMREWLAKFFDACETPDVSDELAFYADQVQYFDHGTVDRDHVRTELLAHVQQWLDRQFTLGDSVTIRKSGDHTVVRCRVRFELANAAGTRKATGQAINTFTLARTSDTGWEIVGHKEQRVRKNSGRRSSTKASGRRLTPLDRTLRKFFGSSKKR